MNNRLPDIEEIHIDETIDVIGRNRRSLEGPCVKRVCFTPIGTICLRGRWMDAYDFIRNQPDYNLYIYHTLVYVYGFVRSSQQAKNPIKRTFECHTPTSWHPSTFHLIETGHQWGLVRHNRIDGKSEIEKIQIFSTFPVTYLSQLNEYQREDHCHG